MEETIKKINYLSASKIKTLNSCTWQYYCAYELGIPQKSNSGASRGTIVHNLFELISKPKHQHYINKIWVSGSPEKVPQIKKFLINEFKKQKISLTEEVKPIKSKYGKKNNWDTICDMILTTLKHEFIAINHSKIIDSEYEFNIVNENPKYAVRGFIDRVEIENENTIKILDYKSSSKKFSGEDEESNIQAMIYSLVARKIWKNYKNYTASFFFMRFPEDPYQNSEFSKNELDGLEHYLEYISEILENFDIKKAKSSMAAFDNAKSWLCGRGSWVCPYKNALTFFKVFEKNNDEKKYISSHFELKDAEEKISKNKKEDVWDIEMVEYTGCPAFSI
jgi:ATP-dependent helicase/DNAse subunit B